MNNNVNEITVPRWFDRHLHIRDHEMRRLVLPCTVNQKATGAVLIGNLPPPDEISTIAKALRYKADILYQLKCLGSDFQPRLTCFLTDEITPEEVVRGFQEEVWCAVKLMMTKPDGGGGTTNSSRAVKNLLGRYPVFEAMEKHQIPLLGHFEVVEDDVDEFDREVRSLEKHLMPIVKSFPGFPIVVEHVTDGRMADFVAGVGHNIQATVSAQHLMINRNSMFENGMNPGYYCKPVPKRESHRLRIRRYVTSGNRRFGAGTDSAPHDESTKSRCYGCNAGIFTAPCAVELYTTVFDEENALEHLGPFLSENFVGLYGMEVSKETITIRRTPHKIPEKIGNIPVFLGGQTSAWTLVD